MQIKDLTVDEFKALIRATLEEALQDLLVDPDAGRLVKASIEQQLLDQREQRQLGKTQMLSSDEAMKELGLMGTSKNTNLVENMHKIPMVSGSSDLQ